MLERSKGSGEGTKVKARGRSIMHAGQYISLAVFSLLVASQLQSYE